MRKHIRHAREDVERFGFQWDQLDVIRSFDFSGTKVVQVSTDFGYVEIRVSKTGRSIRVFKVGGELK